MPEFVHLHVHSPYSFQDGASSIDDLVKEAAAKDMSALALTDHANVSAAVRFARLAQQSGIKPIQGAEVTTAGGHHLTLLARDASGYANLCRLLTRAHLDHPRGEPQCDHLEEYHEGIIALSGCRKGEIPSLILRRRYTQATEVAKRYKDLWGKDFYLELPETLLPGSRFLNHHLVELGETLGIPVVATNNVHYARPEDFPVHDLLTCARLKIAVEEAHPDRPLNGENYVKSGARMARLLAWCPKALENTMEIAARCEPVLRKEDRYPEFPLPEGRTANVFLRELVREGAKRRYGRITHTIRERLTRELQVIEKLGFAGYFLVVWDVVNFAREKSIRCAGRGSAGASAVAYCLYLSEVDPIARNLVFERFLSLERAEKPDIDLDFDSRHRDRVTRYVYDKYGEERVASVATYSTYQARSAVRDLGPVLGYPPREIDALAKSMPYIRADQIVPALDHFPELRRGPWREERYRRLFQFCDRIAGFPRFLGTHLGGLIVTRDPITTVTPLQMAAKGVRIAQFDRDDVEDLNLVKLDLLSLKTLSVLEDAAGATGSGYEKLPLNDRATYKLLSSGQTVGVFQLESPAQRALQQKLHPTGIEDVVASVALIRPGPVKGNMVEPFVARRQGREEVTHLHPSLSPILDKTYGVVLFQEQVIAIATGLAGFTPGEADSLRRLMTHARSAQEMRKTGEEFVRRAVARGIEEKTAREVFAGLEGYAGYGFCEAHAAAFATTAYWTAYLAAHHPAHFFTALLNNQPMGYYSPATLANEARLRGLRFLPPDLNTGGETFALEDGAIRVPLSRVKDMDRPTLADILARRPFLSPVDFRQRTRVEKNTLESMILCGALDSLHPNRRELLAWLPGIPPLSPQAALDTGPPKSLPDFSPLEKHILEHRILGLDLHCHYMAFWRSRLQKEGYLTGRQLRARPGNTWIRTAGVPVRPHRPPTRSGRTVVFFSLEDETGLTEVTLFDDVYQRYGQHLFGPRRYPLRVEGILERRDRGVGLTGKVVEPLKRQGEKRDQGGM
ncbi:MAG: DNA polymerase III subunit alpha [Peptococcaceae bacterium]|jgi:error-prone DNA polymerase|nr:DNA polymerase III subunit alpha [Peptococcaceae bacterium]